MGNGFQKQMGEVKGFGSMCTVKPHNGGIPKTKEPRMRWQQSLVLQFWNVLTI